MPLPSTLTPIATNTLTATASTVTFSSIPQNYTDLIIASNTLSAGTTQTIMMRFNGDSGSNYSFTFVYGTGSAAASGAVSNVSFALGGFATATNAAVSNTQIMYYSNSTTYKTVIDRRGVASEYTFADVSLWRNNNAITSLSLQPENSQSFASGSTFTLYGIKAA